MDMKIYRNIHLRVISILMCLLLAVIPFFHPKKVNANPAIVFVGIISILATGMIAGKYVSDTVLTPEQINNANDYCTANLQTAFPDPAEYNKQLTALQNLDNDIRAGKDIDWSKYSGKALYAVLKGVVDVVWPNSNSNMVEPPTDTESLYSYIGQVNGVHYYYGMNSSSSMIKDGTYSYAVSGLKTKSRFDNDNTKYYFIHLGAPVSMKSKYPSNYVGGVLYYLNSDGQIKNCDSMHLNTSYDFGTSCGVLGFTRIGATSQLLNYLNGSMSFADITAKTANKVKLPTRLPQTVINNINNYIDGSTENLIVNPTPDELPQLPEGYNPVTDDLPDLPGYEDVTPDQEPTTDPEPTPTPPDPTPTPPEYNGDEWVNPIGNFFDGLLKFMKAAFVPTLSLDLSALSNMPENFTDKFPFSLPSDIVSIFGVINADPVAPSFSFTFPLSYVGGEDMDASFNLDNFNDAAAVIRSLLLLVVVVLLAWKTYGLVGGDS